MTKKRSIVKLCIVTALTLIGLFLTFFSFVIPGTNTTFKGFINAINYGYDLNGGVLAVYESFDKDITGYDLENRVETTVDQLNKALGGNRGFNVTKQNENVRIEVSQVHLNEINNKISNAGFTDIFALINAEKGIIFSNESDYEKAKENATVTGEDILSCGYKYQNQWVIDIQFTEQGKKDFKALTQKVADGGDTAKLYMFVDGTDKTGGGMPIQSSMSSLMLPFENQLAAEAWALSLSVLAKPLILSQVSCDVVNAGLNTSTTPFFGNEASLMVCALVLIAIGAVTFLCVRYRVLGALATLAMGIFISVYSFLLQSIPLVIMDLNGVVGTLITFAILFAGIVTVFERIKKEYAVGKKIPNSVTSGFKKNLLPILERYVFIIVLTAIMFIVGTPALKAMAVTLFIGLFVNYFTLFGCLFGICKLYLPINSTKKQYYNLKREGVKREI